MSQGTSSEPSSSNISSSAPSVVEQLDRLTTAVQELGDGIQTCTRVSDEHRAAILAHQEEDKERRMNMQEQVAKILAMTQETLRKQREEPVVSGVPASRRFARDLQRAAFGTGRDAESVSRSSMLESQSIATNDSVDGSERSKI